MSYLLSALTLIYPATVIRPGKPAAGHEEAT